MPMLKVKGLTKNFGGLVAVDTLDFHVNPGEILGLIGPNGAGKSTVFNLITSYLRLQSGQILFQDEDITHQSTHKVAAKGVIRTFQQNDLFMDMTVYQNLAIASHRLCKAGSWGHYLNTHRARRDEQMFEKSALEILDFFGLMPFRDEKAKNLPHGYQRVLGVAIGMAAKPKLLLLDEPFTGMNPKETETAMEMVKRIKGRGITIILVEHNMRAVMEICERIAVLNFGKKIAEGTPEEIQGNKDVIEAYLGQEEEL
jgi:branched-chain amino acid transport system ATP-binding protein